jgi:hypothetical protein
MPDIPYTKVKGISPIPIITIYFNNPDNSSMTANSGCGILDTGSDLTIVSFGIISQLQATATDKQKAIPFRGLGRSTQGIPYRVGMSFDGTAFFGVKVIAIPDDVLSGEVIIGRNILNRYAIEFDGPNLVFKITNNKKYNS